MPSLDLSEGQLAFLEVLGIVGTVAAAFLAAWSIIQARRQAKKSADALLQERRLDFELGVLRDLADVFVERNPSVTAKHSRAVTLLEMLPPDGLEVARATFWVDGDAAHQQLRSQVVTMGGNDILQADLNGQRVIDRIGDELIAAIRSRVRHRD